MEGLLSTGPTPSSLNKGSHFLDVTLDPVGTEIIFACVQGGIKDHRVCTGEEIQVYSVPCIVVTTHTASILFVSECGPATTGQDG